MTIFENLPTAATRVPVPPIRRLMSINFRGGATPVQVPGWEPNRFAFINSDMQAHNGYTADCLAYDRENAYRNHKLWIDASDPHPLIVIDCEADDVWEPKHFARMEEQRAAIKADPIWKHCRVAAYVGNMYQLLTQAHTTSFYTAKLDFLEQFAKPFDGGISVPVYTNHGDSDQMPRQLVKWWRHILPLDKIIPTFWWYVKAAPGKPGRNCTASEFANQLAAVQFGMRECILWGDCDGNDTSGGDSDERTLQAFVNQLKGTP